MIRIMNGGKKEMARQIKKGYSIILTEVKNGRVFWEATSISNNATWKNIYNLDTIKQAMEGVDQLICMAENV